MNLIIATVHYPKLSGGPLADLLGSNFLPEHNVTEYLQYPLLFGIAGLGKKR